MSKDQLINNTYLLEGKIQQMTSTLDRYLSSDFNFNNKILGRQSLAHAEKNGLIAKEQYGSRKGKSAIEHAIHKRITYNIIRQF